LISRRAAEVLSRAKVVTRGGALRSIISAGLAVRAASTLTVDRGTKVPGITASSTLTAILTRRATRVSFTTAITVRTASGGITVETGFAASVCLTARAIGRAAPSSWVVTFSVTGRACSLPDHQETTDEVNVVRSIFALQVVLHGLQHRVRGVLHADIRRIDLRDDEAGGEETKEGRPE